MDWFSSWGHLFASGSSRQKETSSGEKRKEASSGQEEASPQLPESSGVTPAVLPDGSEEESSSALVMDMTPLFPRVDVQVMPEGGGSFEDRVLLLLATVVRGETFLTSPAYEAAARLVQSLFGERAQEASFQARFHYALLHPADNPDELAAALAREAVEEKVSGAQIAALLRALDALQAGQGSGAERRSLEQLRQSLVWAFEKERRSAQQRQPESGEGVVSRLEEGAKFGVQAGKDAVDGTVQLVQNVFGMASRFLPREEVVPSPALSPDKEGLKRRMAESGRELARAAWVLEEEEVRQELNAFLRLLADQPFRVVLVGEGKRGKSSLVNALLGEALSPVRESLPETAAVAEFSYAETPAFHVTFLDDEQYKGLDLYLAGEPDHENLRQKLEERRRRVREIRPQSFGTLNKGADIADYLSAKGRFASLAGKVSLTLPLESLKSGMVLVDTPGLNATDVFHEYLAYEESLKADCILFVMDARRPASGSELRLLRKLAASGRALSLIGVLTGADRLNEAESRREAEAQALAVLQEACRDAAGLNVAGLVSINARSAMEMRCPTEHLFPSFLSGGEKKEVRSSLEELLRLMGEAMHLAEDKTKYREKITARARQLAVLVRERGRTAFVRYRQSLPPAHFITLLTRHTGELVRAADSHAEQAYAVIAAAARDVEEWQRMQERALDQWEKDLMNRLMLAAHRHADSLGTAFARESSWKRFDAEEAPRIAREAIRDFLDGQQEDMQAWNEKLKLFQGRLNELSVLCLHAVEESSAELGDICSTTGKLDHLLVQTNARMKQVATFLAGAGTGAVAASSLMNLVTLGSAAMWLLTDLTTFGGVTMLGAAAYAVQQFGDPQRRKAAFLERKRKKSEQWVKEMRLKLEEELNTARQELTEAYKNSVARGFLPALEILTGEAVHLKLYLAVMEEIRRDADRFEQRLEDRLSELEEAGEMVSGTTLMHS